jgi:hypothetical protein
MKPSPVSLAAAAVVAATAAVVVVAAAAVVPVVVAAVTVAVVAAATAIDRPENNKLAKGGSARWGPLVLVLRRDPRNPRRKSRSRGLSSDDPANLLTPVPTQPGPVRHARAAVVRRHSRALASMGGAAIYLEITNPWGAPQ